MHSGASAPRATVTPRDDGGSRAYRPPDAAPPPRDSVSAAAPSRWWPARVLAALAIALISFLPLANWIEGGHENREYELLWRQWRGGILMVALAGLALAALSRRVPVLWRAGLAARLGDRLWRSWAAYAVVLALVTLALSAWTADGLFDRQPSTYDEMSQLEQAHVYAQGRLATPVGEHPELFLGPQMVVRDGKMFSQFPPGGPAMLALGVLAGAPWLLNPVLAALGVLLWAWCLRRAEPDGRVAVLALALFAVSPFVIFLAGSHMNHAAGLLWLNLACAALAALVADDRRRAPADPHAPATETPIRPWLGLLAGLALGAAATIRPADALAFALPAGVWVLVRALRTRRRWAEAIPFGIGAALPIAAMMWVHVQTTGKPLLFGYELLWGSEHSLGFHATPWGAEHTPARGLELLSLYGIFLQALLFDTALPGLLPFIVALALVPRLRAFERYLLASGLLLALVYFAYFFDGFFLGPRFMLPLVPLLTWWTARALPIVASRFRAVRPGSLAYRAIVYASLASVALGLTLRLPARARHYARLVGQKWDAAEAARRAGMREAIVLVPDTWASRHEVRMRALGLGAQLAQRIPRGVDACRLEHALRDLERRGVRGDAAAAALVPLLADSQHVAAVTLPSNVVVRVWQGSAWAPRCMRMLEEDQRGAIPLPAHTHTPLPGVVFARDLHGRDTVLFRRYPDREVWVLRTHNGRVDGTPTLHRAPKDSLFRAWEAMR